MRTLNKPYLIAEVAQAHDGSLGILHSYIDSVATTGFNAIKFQTHIAEAESSVYEEFRVNFSYIDRTRYDYWRRMEYDIDQWREIKSHCDDVGLDFISSPFSCAAVELLESVGVDKYKIGSGEVTNHLMLSEIAKTNRDVLLSSGMSSIRELENSYRVLSEGKGNITVMQCTTDYPTRPMDIGFNVIEELKSKFGNPVGFSDHSGTIYAPLTAFSLGASVIEVHVVFDRRMFGPDARASLEIDEMKTLSEGIDYIYEAFINPVEKNVEQRSTLKDMFGKSLCVNRPLAKGVAIEKEFLESKKPAGFGVPARDYTNVIGKRLNRELDKWDFLTYDDISG